MYNTFYVCIVYSYPFIYFPGPIYSKKQKKTYYLHNHALFFKINKDKFVGGGERGCFCFSRDYAQLFIGIVAYSYILKVKAFM